VNKVTLCVALEAADIFPPGAGRLDKPSLDVAVPDVPLLDVLRFDVPLLDVEVARLGAFFVFKASST
jgi:hypothetical protein